MDNVLSHLNGRSLKLIERYNIITIEKSKKERFLHATFNSHIYLYIIFHLAVVSLERLHATLRPFRHRQLSLKVYVLGSHSSTMDSFLVFNLHAQQVSPGVILTVFHYNLLNNFWPLLLIYFSYLSIWRKMRKSAMKSCRKNQEARFSRSIFQVTVDLS